MDADQLQGDEEIRAAWRENRRYLLDVAYRMLGSISEAEDVVQEAFARLVLADRATIQDLRGWLVVVVTRLCLDELRSARARRETYVGPWLPEPVVQAAPPGGDPADRITLDDSVRIAMLVVLERLSPAERAAFVLHDVFKFAFEDVGRIVGRSPEACRQLASRARRHIAEQTGPARFEVDPVELRWIVGRFMAAANEGDREALMDVLDPDVVGWTDTGGLPGAPLGPITGRKAVVSVLLRFLGEYGVTLAPTTVNGEPGAIGFRDGAPMSVIAFETHGGRITRIHGIANPEKLANAGLGPPSS